MIESIDLHKYLPSTVEMCSSPLGWRSLLRRHHVHDTDAEESELPPMADQTVALVTRGASVGREADFGLANRRLQPLGHLTVGERSDCSLDSQRS